MLQRIYLLLVALWLLKDFQVSQHKYKMQNAVFVLSLQDL